MLAALLIRLSNSVRCAQIIWHDPRSMFPGETMLQALEAGDAYFGARPDILFVCLPDTGARPDSSRFLPSVCLEALSAKSERLSWH